MKGLGICNYGCASTTGLYPPLAGYQTLHWLCPYLFVHYQLCYVTIVMKSLANILCQDARHDSTQVMCLKEGLILVFSTAIIQPPKGLEGIPSKYEMSVGGSCWLVSNMGLPLHRIFIILSITIGHRNLDISLFGDVLLHLPRWRRSWDGMRMPCFLHRDPLSLYRGCDVPPREKANHSDSGFPRSHIWYQFGNYRIFADLIHRPDEASSESPWQLRFSHFQRSQRQ